MLLHPIDFDATAAKIAQINARAERRGFTGRIEITGTEVTKNVTNAFGHQHDVVYIDTEIVGEAPCYGGWQFLAAVDTVQTEDGESFILRVAPGISAEEVNRDELVTGRCQHCGVAKANRIYTYLVRNTETGEVKQVGSTCIRDFTGWQGNPVFVSVDDVEREILGGVSASAPALPPVEVVAVAYAAVRTYGWVPASAYDGVNTRTIVDRFFFGNDKAARIVREDLEELVDEGQARAAEIITALREGLTGESDYVQNLRTALSALYVGPKQLGLVVSAVSAYDRLMGRKAAEREKIDRSNVKHAGAVGEKVTVTGTITGARYCEGAYGVSRMIVVENDKTVAKTFTTAAWSDEVEIGDNVTLIGTVKKHDAFQGIPQTLLTRCKRVAS